MVDSSQMTNKLLELMQKTGYPLVQQNGQRLFGPPPDWNGQPPQRGCEVFIGKLPRDIFEDELVPLFSRVGKLYEMRLMMDFSGYNRGFAFVTYATKAEAAAAIRQLDGYEIRPKRKIGVAKSVDNCRLFVGNIPKTMTKEEIMEELSQQVSGIVDVILFKSCFNRMLNRGFAFVEFKSHQAAAKARRSLLPGALKLRDQYIIVDWAEPEPNIDDDKMKKVKVLFARNLEIRTTPGALQKIFENAINNKVERVKKIKNYAFISFSEREHAELAMTKLQNVDIDGSNIEIVWAKPVDRDLYHMQKLRKGNAKFNNNFHLTQTLLLYKQHLKKKEYSNSSTDEGFGSSPCAEGSSCYSSSHLTTPCYVVPQINYTLAPAKLEDMCKRFMWPYPTYQHINFNGPNGAVLWACTVELPYVGMPLLPVPQRIGPFSSRIWPSAQLACVEAAGIAIESLKMMRVDITGQSTPQPVYTSIQPVPSCARLPYEYTQVYPQAHL